MEEDKATYYFITDFRKMSQDNFLRLELIAAIEAKELQWKLFLKCNSKAIGIIYISLN